MIVVITDAAEADLEQIGDYIARDNPRRAVSFISELIAACQHLSQTPFGFSLVPRHEASGVRRLPHGHYLIFYRVALERIELLRILHGAMHYEPLLFPDD